MVQKSSLVDSRSAVAHPPVSGSVVHSVSKPVVAPVVPVVDPVVSVNRSRVPAVVDQRVDRVVKGNGPVGVARKPVAVNTQKVVNSAAVGASVKAPVDRSTVVPPVGVSKPSDGVVVSPVAVRPPEVAAVEGDVSEVSVVR